MAGRNGKAEATETALAEFNERLESPVRDPALLERVFMHRSYLNEAGGQGLESNERLEFLGDSVLSTVISQVLYDRFPEVDEGGLTRLRARLVNRVTLAGLAKGLGLDKLLFLGKGEAASGGHENPTILAGAFEALLAAVYLDSGFERARPFIEKLFAGIIDESVHDPVHFDYKPRLQVLCQALYKEAPEYRLIDEAGPPHERVFTVEVLVGGETLGLGTAGRKKDAEQTAAKEALERLEQRKVDEDG